MAMIDSLSEFCDGTALNTGGAGTYNVGNSIDLTTPRDIGSGRPLYLVIKAKTDITVASSTGTVKFKLVSDATSTIATDGSATDHVVTPAYATSTTAIAAGTTLYAGQLPLEGNVYEQYLALQQVTGTTALNAGSIDAYLVVNPQAWKALPDAI